MNPSCTKAEKFIDKDICILGVQEQRGLKARNYVC